jgi:hypothetical protein
LLDKLLFPLKFTLSFSNSSRAQFISPPPSSAGGRRFDPKIVTSTPSTVVGPIRFRIILHMLRFLFMCTLPTFTLAWAQPAFFNLAPNGDGSQLWFASWLRLRDTDGPAHPKIFT